MLQRERLHVYTLHALRSSYINQYFFSIVTRFEDSSLISCRFFMVDIDMIDMLASLFRFKDVFSSFTAHLVSAFSTHLYSLVSVF